MLPAGIKITPDEILETTRCKTNKCSYVRAGLLNNAIIKLTCTWMMMKLRIKTMILKVAQKMNNLLDI